MRSIVRRALVMVTVLLALPIWCLCDSATIKITIPTQVLRRTMIANGVLYSLSNGSSSVVGHPLNGDPNQYYDVGKSGVMLMSGISDFLLDIQGNLHFLAYRLPEKNSCVVVYDRAKSDYRVVILGKPLYAQHIEIDAQGNYYLLGIDPSLSDSILKGQKYAPNTYLVHKYLPTGEYIASYLPVNSPTNADEFRSFISMLSRPNSFMVLPSGEAYFYQLVIDSKTAPWNLPRTIYYIDLAGIAHSIEPTSPPNNWLVGIHKFRGDVAFEWAGRQASESKLIMRKNGSLLGRVPGGRILAASDDGLTATGTNRKGIYEISLNPIQ
jgi:hypothetical protein